MIQEILDCLLIKAHFIVCNEEELLEKVQDDNMLEIYCSHICHILEEDDFFYSSDELIQKLEYIVYKKRFEKKYNNGVIGYFNIMVDAINKYKRLSTSDKMIIGAKWIDKEAQNRNLPFRRIPGYTLYEIYELIKNECYYAKILLLDDLDLEVYNPLHLYTTINILCHCYPDALLENLNAMSRCCAGIELLKDIYKKNLLFRIILKNTYKLLDNIAERIPDEDFENYEKVLKKTEK